MKILRVKKFQIYDVFIGEGWSNWTRILNPATRPIIIGGALLPASLMRSVLQSIKKQFSKT